MSHRLRNTVIATFALLLVCLTGAGAQPQAGLPDRLVVDVAGQAITVWSRQAAHPQAAVVLVHGLTWSARPAFDFEPRSGSRSLLRALAAAGFAVYALDLPGYGSSPREPSGWLAPERAVQDVEGVLRFVAQRHADLPAPVLLGWSRGSKISALVATHGRQPLSALVLYAYNFNPAAPPANGPAAGRAPALPNTVAWARSDFISPQVAGPELIADFVSAALGADPVRVDVCCDAQFRAIRPEAIRIPTLLIHGARDPAFRPAVASDFFGRLAAVERRWIIVGDADHAAHLEDTAPEVTAAMIDFIDAAVAPGRH